MQFTHFDKRCNYINISTIEHTANYWMIPMIMTVNSDPDNNDVKNFFT